MGKTVITIGREYGSGGRYIGQKLAEALGIPFYDKELIAIASAESGINPKLIEELDEKGANRFFYSLSTNKYMPSNLVGTGVDLSMNDRLFLLQSKAIKKIADEGSAVIVGRCGDYVLQSYKNAVHIFIHSSEESRLERIVKYYGVSPAVAGSVLAKTDKNRAKYYNYYTGKKWGIADNYTLSIDSSIGIDECVAVIKTLIEQINK